MRADDQAQDDMPRKCVWGRLFLCLHFQSINSTASKSVLPMYTNSNRLNELQIRFVFHIRLDLIKRRSRVW